MRIFTLKRCQLALIALLGAWQAKAQTPAFPGAMGFGKYAPGVRGSSTREVYVVTNLNDSGTGSFRDAVSKSGRVVVFAVGGIVKLTTDVSVASNITIAGQTAPGDGIVFFNKGISFTGADNTICRFLRIRLGATGNSGNDATGLAHGRNIIFDHLSVSWGMDENFSINWDNKGNSPDNITIQNSIIGQGLFRENHSAGGLIQTPDGGRVSLLQNLYMSNKTRNPKVKGVNEFVNNVVYDWGNGHRLDQDFNYEWAADAYIMGGSTGVSEVNVINNYFVGGPLTPPTKTTPFSRGTGTFNIYGSGNYFDNNQNGALDGAEVPFDSTGYPGITAEAFKQQPFLYPTINPTMTAAQAYQHVLDSVGAWYPRRDQVDGLMLDEVASKGTKGMYVYRETDLPFSNGGLGNVFGAPAPLDTDGDGMPDAWEDANGLNKNDKSDAVAFSTNDPRYLNIEMYINSLVSTPPPVFIKPPTNLALTATSVETPPSSKVKLTWVDNADNETNFVVERSTNGSTFTDIAHPNANALTYTDSVGLVPNTTYYYRVKAVNATDVSAYTSVVSIATPPVPTAPALTANPTPTNGFQYASLTSGKLTLKWTGGTNTLTYSVYLGTDTASMVKQGDVAYSTAPSYTTGVLNDNTVYYWRVDAVNAKGLAKGQVWSFRTPPIIPQGLVGNWAFDEPLDAGTTQVADSTAYNNTGALGLDADNNVRIVGKIKNGLDFASADPSIYVVRLPNQDQLYLDKSSFSISFWMKAPATLLPQDNNTSAYLLCKGSITRNATTGALGKRFDIEFKNKQIRFAIDDDNDAGGGGKDELQVNGVPFFTNNWTHVVVVRDVTSKKLLMYMNGTQVGSVAISKANSGIGEASALVLGNIGELEFLATTNKPAPYKGMLDEVKVYNYVLSPSEITALASVKNTQTIAFTAIPEQKVDAADFAPQAIASSGLPVTLSSSDTTVATIVNGKIHIIAAGTANITAKQGGDANYYAAANASQQLKVTKYNQTIDFAAIAEQKVDAADFAPQVVASSGLPVTLSSSDTTVATIVNGKIHVVAAGMANIMAKQNGNAKYYSADSTSQQLTVTKYKQTIAFSTLPGKIAGDADFSISATASSGLPVTFTSSNNSVATVSGNTVHITGTGSVLIKATQAGNAHYADTSSTQTLTVRNLNVQVQALDGDNGKLTNNTIRPYLKLVNSDSVAVTYNQLTARYWFTAENFTGINTFIDYAQMGSGNVSMQYVALSQPRNGALGYVEYTFTGNTSLAAGANSGPIQSRVANKDWSDLSEADDYSYPGSTSTYTANPHITLYRNGLLIYGQEPEVAPAVAKVNVTYQSQNGGNNTIGTYLAVNNTGNVPLNYGDLKVRYWFTKEGTASLNYTVDYAKLGNSQISGTFAPISPVQNADTYLELSFASSAGALSPLSSTGNIQYRITKTDWSAFTQTNDYSYLARTSAMQENSHIAVYYQGQLIYGTEPGTNGTNALALNNYAASMLAPVQNGSSLANDLPESILVYPNPLASSRQLSVNLTSDLLNKDINLKIVNSFGQVMQTNSFHGNNGSISFAVNGNYMPGVYFIKVNDKPMVRLLVN
ncbi:cellulose binding domain-containing protein [Mucilaginibacter yixingensis]|uniref:Cellulose binding domain-containing protein n=1 Tax=Mucilaginibacter yixingensis TaxID=1295612 RepID=A0A2T5JG76_9SPHI|nr:cellulose binding domain-containing protein [Mucilaginibacter yixingensis]PTR01428.1 cellulose binding domain-containing protein [Mucilaginibacter yixingensis]